MKITNKMSTSALKNIQNSENLDIFPSTKKEGKFFFTCGLASKAIENKLLPADAPTKDKDGNPLSFAGYVSESAVKNLEEEKAVNFAIIDGIPCLMGGATPKWSI